MNTIRIATAQTPDFRDDTPAALAHLNVTAARAQADGASLIVFPEAYLQGYLLAEQDARRVAFDLASQRFSDILAQFPAHPPTLVLGLIEVDGPNLFNTAIVVRQRKLIGRYRKTHLLAAERAFSPGSDTPVFDTDGLRFGINICHDTNFPEPARTMAKAGATLLLCCANNMLPRPRAEAFRHVHNTARAKLCRETNLWLISSDVTGTRDGMAAWGPSAVISPEGEIVAQLPLDQPGLLTFDLPVSDAPNP
ncbi:MAG: carbon-nitrogen hydrolase family protein [Paracoccaceae bacterium]